MHKDSNKQIIQLSEPGGRDTLSLDSQNDQIIERFFDYTVDSL